MNNPHFIRPGMTGDMDATAKTIEDSVVEPNEGDEKETEAAREARKTIDPMKLEIDQEAETDHDGNPSR